MSLKPTATACLILLACLPHTLPSAPLPTEPVAQLVIPCTITEWYDGDTPTVEVTLRIRVRLKDCWAPEVTGRNKAQGLASRDHALQTFPTGSKAMLTVELEGVDRLDGILSFGRVVGKLTVAKVDVATSQVRAGHATATK